MRKFWCELIPAFSAISASLSGHQLGIDRPSIGWTPSPFTFRRLSSEPSRLRKRVKQLVRPFSIKVLTKSIAPDFLASGEAALREIVAVKLRDGNHAQGDRPLPDQRQQAILTLRRHLPLIMHSLACAICLRTDWRDRLIARLSP